MLLMLLEMKLALFKNLERSFETKSGSESVANEVLFNLFHSNILLSFSKRRV